ncbi:hypothetical protein BHU72_00970 [Desulfuribacillus stibiiarsenatis]|uniref:Uncharacterized protein n=1 Tax=Desulfuribacillus stibiiarsenatis TaxID=1390249 RepID=A0A1E5L9Q8_9FIRM|nr:hypothetical protein [Desulfuribacillus stibiiarsenatis]OEH86867.1 hypothetical protein BHU72_00970 [Desulfuribacillus stibiiarsenatis]
MSRLSNDILRSPNPWEIIAGIYLLIWYFRKRYSKEKLQTFSPINIENKNTIQILNNSENLDPQKD